MRRGVVIAVAVAAFATSGAGARTTTTRVPFLPQTPEIAPERTWPPPVMDAWNQRIKTLMARLKRERNAPATQAAGCAVVTYTGGHSSLGAPAPRFTARALGHYVEVDVAYDHMPSSAACRPSSVSVVIYSGVPGKTFSNGGATGNYLLRGPRGRLLVTTPARGTTPPFHIEVSAVSELGRPGPEVRRPLACPRRRCLPGYPQTLPAGRVAATPAQLTASFRYVLAGSTWPTMRDVRCTTVSTCHVTYTVPGLPKSPYVRQYRVAADSAPGCWLASLVRTTSTKPFPDAPVIYDLAGCVAWTA